jgi:hypothetical protein
MLLKPNHAIPGRADVYEGIGVVNLPWNEAI